MEISIATRIVVIQEACVVVRIQRLNDYSYTLLQKLICSFENHVGFTRQNEVILCWIYTLLEIFIFCSKIQLWFPEKIVDFLGWKTREIVVVLDFLAVDNLDFTRKIVKKIGKN